MTFLILESSLDYSSPNNHRDPSNQWRVNVSICDVCTLYKHWFNTDPLIGKNGCGAELRRLLQVGPGGLGRFIATARTTGLCQWVAIRRPENAVKVDQVNRTHYCIVPPPSPLDWLPGVPASSHLRTAEGGAAKETEIGLNWTRIELKKSWAGVRRTLFWETKDFFWLGSWKNWVDGRKDLRRWTSLKSWSRNKVNSLSWKTSLVCSGIYLIIIKSSTVWFIQHLGAVHILCQPPDWIQQMMTIDDDRGGGVGQLLTKGVSNTFCQNFDKRCLRLV